MRLSEIIEELPKLTTEEKKQLRDLLDSDLSWSQEEGEILEEGLRSRGEEPMRIGLRHLIEALERKHDSHYADRDKERWSSAVMEYWTSGLLSLHYSITELLNS